MNLVNKFSRELNRTKFYKLLFLLSQKQDVPSYNFVPYQYGCYSFLAEKDLSVLKKFEYLENSNKIKIKNFPTEAIVSEDSVSSIEFVLKKYGNLTSKDLIGFVYNNYPYYAKKSHIRDKFLSKTILNKFNDDICKAIYSIGYEGKDIDEYLNTLISHNITLLCDVRKNPISMKFGFSKNQLKSYCEKLDIKYLHFPQFGIDSVKRKKLETDDDYAKLFTYYRNRVLPLCTEHIENLVELISTHRKIAFTCFEADSNMCHRSYLLDYIFKSKNLGYKLIHL